MRRLVIALPLVTVGAGGTLEPSREYVVVDGSGRTHVEYSIGDRWTDCFKEADVHEFSDCVMAQDEAAEAERWRPPVPTLKPE